MKNIIAYEKYVYCVTLILYLTRFDTGLRNIEKDKLFLLSLTFLGFSFMKVDKL